MIKVRRLHKPVKPGTSPKNIHIQVVLM